MYYKKLQKGAQLSLEAVHDCWQDMCNEQWDRYRVPQNVFLLLHIIHNLQKAYLNVPVFDYIQYGQLAIV